MSFSTLMAKNFHCFCNLTQSAFSDGRAKCAIESASKPHVRRGVVQRVNTQFTFCGRRRAEEGPFAPTATAVIASVCLPSRVKMHRAGANRRLKRVTLTDMLANMWEIRFDASSFFNIAREAVTRPAARGIKTWKSWAAAAVLCIRAKYM
jgi:hypothetical protein